MLGLEGIGFGDEQMRALARLQKRGVRGARDEARGAGAVERTPVTARTVADCRAGPLPGRLGAMYGLDLATTRLQVGRYLRRVPVADRTTRAVLERYAAGVPTTRLAPETGCPPWTARRVVRRALVAMHVRDGAGQWTASDRVPLPTTPCPTCGGEPHVGDALARRCVPPRTALAALRRTALGPRAAALPEEPPAGPCRAAGF